MYDRRKRQWVSDWKEDGPVINLEACDEKNPEIGFLLASRQLETSERGKENAEAVYRMEEAAKAGYEPAMLAMGQMFRYGWGVGKSRKMAVRWYKKAVRKKYEPAVREWKAWRRYRVGVWGSLAAVFLLTAAILAFMWISREGEIKTPKKNGIKVAKDTELVTPATLEEFETEIRRLVSDYDDEMVISGQRSTNRLILRFEGGELDLSGFLADRVVARENTMVIIQFRDEEEAERCLETLAQMDAVTFVEMDEYDISVQEGETKKSQQDGEVLRDNQSEQPLSMDEAGGDYYSWGCEAMELDRLAAWMAPLVEGQEAKVAVLDTGVEKHIETASRILEGNDMFTGGNGQIDTSGHGTHVSGTILDATRGLEVQILPVRVFGENEKTSTLAICCGLEYAIAQNPDVINMSLGGPKTKEHEMEAALIREAVNQGIVVVVSAGNGDENGIPLDTAEYSPAYMEECIVVGAVDRSGAIAPFSNFGESVDVCAPGVDIVSFGIGGEEFSVKSGTSMAAPHISALAAMLCLYRPEASPAQIEKYIKDYCTSLGDPLYYGEGMPKAGYFVEN